MKSSSLPALTLVWLMLMAATVTTGWLAENDRSIRWAVNAMLSIAVVKIWLIMWNFMELKAAPVAWRLVFAAWLAGVATIVLAG